MKLITQFELANKNIPELRAIYAATHNALIRSNAACIQRSNILASLENISRAMCCYNK